MYGLSIMGVPFIRCAIHDILKTVPFCTLHVLLHTPHSATVNTLGYILNAENYDSTTVLIDSINTVLIDSFNMTKVITLSETSKFHPVS